MGRPRNYYLIPLRLVSAAYFPFLAGLVLVSAGLGVLVLSNLHGRRSLSLGILLLLTSIHIVVGMFALFQRGGRG